MAHLYQLLRTTGALCFLLAAGLGTPLASWAQYTPGNLVVVQVGDGVPFVGNTVTTRLVEISPAGTGSVQSTISLNTIDPGNKLTNTDNSPAEGMITLSADGRYLVTGGFNAPVGTAAATSSAATVGRSVARIDAARNMDISTVLTDAYNGTTSTPGGIRSVASLDGSAFWLAGAGSSALNVHYAPAGASTSRTLSTGVTSTRMIRVMSGNVYFSTGAGTPGIYLLGPASNIGTGQAATLLIGTGASSSPYGFILFDRNAAIAGPDAAYIADENDGVSKWAFDGTTWAKVGTIGQNARGLTGTLNPDGSAQLYVTSRTTAGGNSVVSIVDTNPPAAPPSTTVITSSNIKFTAAQNYALRGIEFAPGTAVVLPVVLTSLAASRTAAGVRLRWATASEHNSAHFEVQRSLDGRTFATVARVAAAGTSLLARTYVSLDDAAPLGALYYRLRQVDQDGSAAYSPVVPAAASPTDPLLAPNPAHDYLHLVAALPTAYTVRSVQGQALLSGAVASGPAVLPVASLPVGVYLLELRTAEGRSVQRFVKN